MSYDGLVSNIQSTVSGKAVERLSSMRPRETIVLYFVISHVGTRTAMLARLQYRLARRRSTPFAHRESIQPPIAGGISGSQPTLESNVTFRSFARPRSSTTQFRLVSRDHNARAFSGQFGHC